MVSLYMKESFNLDDLLMEFSSVIKGDDDVKAIGNHRSSSPQHFSPNLPPPTPPLQPFPFIAPTSELVEEELEWISNKDAFPMVESLADIIPPCGHLCFGPSPSSRNHRRSPISVLENSASSTNSNGGGTKSGTNSSSTVATVASCFSSSLKVPGRARSKQPRKKRRDIDMLSPQWKYWAPDQKSSSKVSKPRRPSSTIGRKCQHCHSETTPQWRAGPNGAKTLCNACGVRYKSGRLVPEYRPANSPTFSSKLHSNSHRKIMEMRKKKQVVMETCDPVVLNPGEIG